MGIAWYPSLHANRELNLFYDNCVDKIIKINNGESLHWTPRLEGGEYKCILKIFMDLAWKMWK
jgi:hypothetical protein